MPITADHRRPPTPARLVYVGPSPARVHRIAGTLDGPLSDARIEAVSRPEDAHRHLDSDVDCLLCDATQVDDAGAFHAAVREADAGVPLLLFGPARADVPSAVYDDDLADYAFVEGDRSDDRRLSHRLRTLSERRERDSDRRFRYLESSLDAVEDVFYLFEPDGRLLRWNDAVPELTGYDDAEIEGMPATEFIAPEDREEVFRAIPRVIEEGPQRLTVSILTKEDERIPHEMTGVCLRNDAGAPIGICGIGRDISDRRRRKSELAAQRAEISELARVAAVVRDVVRSLARATSREGIEQAVCDRLADAEPYSLAWIGRYDAATGRIEPSARAGAGQEHLDGVAVPVDGGPTDRTPSVAAFRTGEVRVVQDLTDADASGAWRHDALDRGYVAGAAVPLVHDETTRGVLHLFADRAFAFDDREVAVLADLGETIGYALASAEQRRALVADTVTELAFRFGDRSRFFADASARTGATFELRSAVPRSDVGHLAYVDCRGVDPEAVRSLAADATDVERARAVSERDDGGLFEFVLRDPSVVTTLADRAAVVRSLTVEDGDGRVTAEVSGRSNVRDVVEAFESAFPESELLVKRERTRPPEERRRSAADASLTDCQRGALAAASNAGFFDSPRRSSGTEIADSLGVSAPTFHNHLRAAERKLARAFLDGSDDG